MSYYRDQLERWLKEIDVDAEKVLDIGGGSLPVNKRVRSWNVGKYVVADNYSESPKRMIDIEMDINLNQEWKETFNIVFCLEVFEYVYNPINAVYNIYNALEYGGRAYITFPFVYPLHEPADKDYLRYTVSGVKKLLREAMFSRVEIYDRMDRSGFLVGFYQADGMHPSKGGNHHATGFLVKATK